MVNKKIWITIGLVLLMFTTFYQHAYAASPNVKDCMEDKADCSKEEGSTSKKTEDSDDTSSDSSSIKNDNGSLLFELVKMVFALLLVIALIYVLLKFLNKRNKLFSQVKALENIGGISVGQNKSIQIVRIGTKVYIIGVGDNVEMLQEITDEEVKNDLLKSNDTKDFQAGNLVTSLFQAKSDEDQTSAKQKKNEFKKLFSTELDRLKQGRKKMINQYEQKEDKHE